jgi:hypothetical protein
MSIAFNGIGEVMATFLTQGEVTGGIPVKLASNATVTPCTSGEAFLGIALEPRDGAAAVQIGGFVTVPYTGTAPKVGRVTLAADGSGGVTVSSGGVSLPVVSVDTIAQTAVIYL